MNSEYSGKSYQVLCFKVDSYQFALELIELTAVTRVLEITPVQGSPKFFDGVITLRGQATPVLNLRTFFGLPPVKIDSASRLLTVYREKIQLSLLADCLVGISHIQLSDAQPTPEILFNSFIKKVGKTSEGWVFFLDVHRLVSRHDMLAVVEKRVTPALSDLQEGVNNHD